MGVRGEKQVAVKSPELLWLIYRCIASVAHDTNHGREGDTRRVTLCSEPDSLSPEMPARGSG